MDLAWLQDLPIEDMSVLAPVYVLSATAALLLIALALRPRPSLRSVAWLLAASGIGAVLGWSAVWMLVDVQDAFGAPASDVIRGAATGAGAVVGMGVATIVRRGALRRAVAVVAVGGALVSAGLLINRDVAYYPRLGDVIAPQDVPALNLHPRPTPSAMTGRVGVVRIPGTVSGFAARDAWVYLPPAALRADPPKLPVVVAMAGQPGGPSDVFEAGNLASVLDGIAAEHDGVAPIVVVPDQLGSYNVNPMCVDSKMGHVATYITVDVRDWILGHLPATAARTGWTVAGFSEGATCAVQFGARRPDLFGSFVAVSPELGPINGTLHRTLNDAFHGDLAAWRAAQPIAIMHRHGVYRHTTAIYAVGAEDRRYGSATPKLAAASRAAGMTVDVRRLDGLAHNWNTGAAGLAYGLRSLTTVWGIR